MFNTQVVFRGIRHSDALELKALDLSDKLSASYPDLIGCRVLIEVSHRHHHKGNIPHVRVEITFPGGEKVASRDATSRVPRQLTFDGALLYAFQTVEKSLKKFREIRAGTRRTIRHMPQII